MVDLCALPRYIDRYQLDATKHESNESTSVSISSTPNGSKTARVDCIQQRTAKTRASHGFFFN